MLPTDPKFRQLKGLQLAYTYHWLKKVEDDFWSRLNHILGTVWSKEDIQGLNKKSSSKGETPEDIFIPLALLINPDIATGLKKSFGRMGSKLIADGEYKPAKGEQIEEMGEWSKEEFLASLNASGIQQSRGVSAPDALPKMDIPNDPATMSRMAAQIAKGKKK